MKYLVSLMSAILFVSTLSAYAEVRENGGLRAPLAVQIEFTSLGNGIDRSLKARVDSVVQEYRDARMVTNYTEKSWGLEGEVTLCVELTDWNTAYVFDQKIAELIGDSNRNTRHQRILSCNGDNKIDPRE